VHTSKKHQPKPKAWPLALVFALGAVLLTAGVATSASLAKTSAPQTSGTEVVLDARTAAISAAQQARYEDYLLVTQTNAGSGTTVPSVASEFPVQFAALSASVNSGGYYSTARGHETLAAQVFSVTKKWIYYNVDLRAKNSDTYACAKVSDVALSWYVFKGICRAH
jgi:hypothetical protein